MTLAHDEHETPDLITSSEDYSRRFAGSAGQYFLSIQDQTLQQTLSGRQFLSVLDVGGGHGQLVPLFLQRDCKLTIFGSKERTHRRVRESFPNADISYASGDFLRLPYEDRSFDLVIAVRLISHINAWEKLIAEFCRVARYSVIIDYPSWVSLNALTPLLFALKKRLEGNTRIYRSFFRSELARTLQEHDFEIVFSSGQFLLPMFVHRTLKGARWLQRIEQAFRTLAVTRRLGSPVVMKADRVGLY